MVIDSYKDITPLKDMVLVEIVNQEKINEDLITTAQSDEMSVAVRYGKVLSLGSDVDLPEHCKGLKTEEIAAFTEFAGYFVVTKENMLLKLIRGYDIIGKCKTMKDIDKLKITPTANRVLVEEYDMDTGSDLILTSVARDPRLADMFYGKIIDVGPSVKNKDLKVGIVVSYAPYVGTTIREKESDEVKPLKIIVEEDILLTVTI